jgi:hypothetical protein
MEEEIDEGFLDEPTVCCALAFSDLIVKFKGTPWMLSIAPNTNSRRHAGEPHWCDYYFESSDSEDSE